MIPAGTLQVVVIVVAIAANLGVAAWVSRRSSSRAAELFVIALVLGSSHGATGVIEVFVTDFRVQIAVGAAQIVLLWASVVAVAGFVVHYVGRESLLTPRRRTALVGVAALGSGLQVTNPLHGLAFSAVRQVNDPYPHLVVEPGPLFWVNAAVGNLVVLGSVALLGWTLLTSRRVNRRQALLLSLGILPSVVVNVAQNAGYLPSNGIDYMPVAAAGFAVVVGYTLFREQLFTVNPVSRAAVIESVTDAVVVLDGRHRVVDFNDAATAVGVSETDIGSDVREALPGVVGGDEPATSADGGTRAVTASLDGDLSVTSGEAGGPVVADADSGEPFADRLVTDRDGDRRTFVVQPSVVGDADSPNGYVVVLRDVTDVEAYAARLQRQTDQLDRFASTVSHDLRNPLSVARGYVETAAETDDSAHLEAALDSLDRADDIIEQSLTLAREGQAIEERERVALATAAREAWATAETGDATLTVATEGVVSADPERLGSLFENLFRNAVEHGGADRVRVADRETGFVVDDDGSGVPEETRERVFDRGFTTNEDGTGLGLAIVESIADAHGWSARVEESPAGGARFGFETTAAGTAESDD